MALPASHVEHLAPIHLDQTSLRTTEHHNDFMNSLAWGFAVFLRVITLYDLFQCRIPFDRFRIHHFELHDINVMAQDHCHIRLAVVGNVLGNNAGIERGEKRIHDRGVVAFEIGQVAVSEIAIGNAGKKAFDNAFGTTLE